MTRPRERGPGCWRSASSAAASPSSSSSPACAEATAPARGRDPQDVVRVGRHPGGRVPRGAPRRAAGWRASACCSRASSSIQTPAGVGWGTGETLIAVGHGVLGRRDHRGQAAPGGRAGRRWRPPRGWASDSSLLVVFLGGQPAASIGIGRLGPEQWGWVLVHRLAADRLRGARGTPLLRRAPASAVTADPDPWRADHRRPSACLEHRPGATARGSRWATRSERPAALTLAWLALRGQSPAGTVTQRPFRPRDRPMDLPSGPGAEAQRDRVGSAAVSPGPADLFAATPTRRTGLACAGRPMRQPCTTPPLARMAELRELARGFEGAYPYLQLIAHENGSRIRLIAASSRPTGSGMRSARESARARCIATSVSASADESIRAIGPGWSSRRRWIASDSRLPCPGDLSASGPHAGWRGTICRRWRRWMPAAFSWGTVSRSSQDSWSSAAPRLDDWLLDDCSIGPAAARHRPGLAGCRWAAGRLRSGSRCRSIGAGPVIG